MLYARNAIDRMGFELSPFRKIPLISPLVVAVLGAIIAVVALRDGGMLKPLFGS